MAKNNNYSEAIEYIDKLKNMEQSGFYTKKNEIEGIDEQYKIWKESQY